MILKINSRIEMALRQSAGSSRKIVAPENTRPRWQKYALWAPYILSLFLILWGIFSLSHRNVIGLGVATACLATGLIAMVKGSIRLQDFID